MKSFYIPILVLPLFIDAGCARDSNRDPVLSSSTDPAMQSVTISPQLQDRAIEIIRSGLKDQNSYIRTQCIEVVVTARRHELMSHVTALLKDPIIPVRFSAALAVGDMQYKPGRAAIESLMRDDNPNVQIAAAFALAKLGNPTYSNLIIQASTSIDQTLRANSALIMGKLGNQGNLPHLNRILQDIESSDRARFQAVESLAMLKDPFIYKSKLWPLLISKHPDDRVIGIRGMAAIGTSEAKNAILTMLDDDIVEVRLCAAGQLAKLNDYSGEQEVLSYLSKNPVSNDSPSVSNTMATLAIGWFRSNQLAAYLPKLIQSRSPLQQIIAAQSILVLAGKEHPG